MEALFSDIQHVIMYRHGLAFLAVFLGGIVSAASPCVLAAVPLVIGYVGGYAGGSRKKAAVYSLAFVLGISIVFTLLGIAASAAGQFLGFMGGWLYTGLALIAILMGLQLLGIISIPLPFQKTRPVKTKGLPGAFLLGALTGAVSSPCATPVLAVILAYISTRGDIFYGGQLLFVYALGHCGLIFIAGLSVGVTESIIGSRVAENFSAYARKFSGALLVAMGVYFGIAGI